jgi:hypothetical protein
MGEHLQGNWTGPNTKDATIRKLSYAKWEGPTTPTFKPQQRPAQSSCIDHLTI